MRALFDNMSCEIERKALGIYSQKCKLEVYQKGEGHDPRDYVC